MRYTIEDLLGAEDKAKEIKKEIQILLSKKESEAQNYKYSTKPSNMYAIYGGWGTGKTRLLEELKVLIENDYKVVWFRPWEYFEESQNIDKKLLSILLDKNKVGKWVCLSLILFVIMTIFTIGNMQWFQANTWQNFIALNIYDYFVVIGGITIIAFVILYKLNLIQYISNLAMGAVGFDITEIFSKLRDYTKYSEDIQKEVSSKIEKQTIVFVDDLDRCRKETVVEVLEHIKHFYASDKLFFVFAIDRKSLATYIAEHYNYQKNTGEIDFDRGYQYLDKLFPDSYNLRYLDGRKLLAKYLKKEDNKIYDELTDTDRENYFLLIEYYATFNWRKVEALIDKFAEIYKKIGYAKVVECYDNKFIYLDQIFRWCLVHEFYPEVFEERNWRKEVIEKFYNNSEDKQDNLFRSNPFSDNNRNIYFQAIEDKEINKTFYLEKLYNYSNTFTSRDQDITYSWSLPNLRNTVEESLLSKLKVYYLNAENSQKEVEVFIKNVHFKYGGNFSDNETDIYNGADDIIKLLKVCIGMEVKKISDPEIQSIKLGSSKVKIAKM
jgi:hypothetical protein